MPKYHIFRSRRSLILPPKWKDGKIMCRFFQGSLHEIATTMDANIRTKLNTLRRQYLQLVEPNKLRWPDAATLKAPDVQSWIYTNLFTSDTNSALPPERYQLRVLKLLISKIEKAIDDPEEDVCHFFFHLHHGLPGPSLPDLYAPVQQDTSLLRTSTSAYP